MFLTICTIEHSIELSRVFNRMQFAFNHFNTPNNGTYGDQKEETTVCGCTGFSLINSIKILSVTVTNRLDFAEHATDLLTFLLTHLLTY